MFSGSALMWRKPASVLEASAPSLGPSQLLGGLGCSLMAASSHRSPPGLPAWSLGCVLHVLPPSVLRAVLGGQHRCRTSAGLLRMDSEAAAIWACFLTLTLTSGQGHLYSLTCKVERGSQSTSQGDGKDWRRKPPQSLWNSVGNKVSHQ